MKKFAIIALLALSGSILTASPEVDEMDRKTADALSQVESTHPGALDLMNKNYLLALQKLETERQKEGDLKQLLMVRDDLKSFTENLEIRKGSSFPRLKLLRDAYLKEFHKLQMSRLQKKLGILEAHRTNLVNLQKKLTRNDLIAEALEVDKALESCGPGIAKARSELAAWSEVKPENSISHLSRKREEESGKPKKSAPEPEPQPVGETVSPAREIPPVVEKVEPPKPVEPAPEPESPFSPPPEQK